MMVDSIRFIRKCLVVLFVGFIVYSGVNFCIEKYYEDRVSEIYAQRSVTLQGYKDMLTLGESYLRVYKIKDDTTYQAIKDELYIYMNNDMRKTIFPTSYYEGLALHTLETELISSKVTDLDGNSCKVWLEYNLQGVNYDQDIINIITIENGLIADVRRVG